MLRRAGAWLLAGMLAACGEDPAGGSWTVRFDCDALADATETLDVQLLKGGCESDAPELYSARLVGEERGPAPPELGPGTYGFRVEARGADGEIVGSRCEQASLPAERDVVVRVADRARLCADAGPPPDDTDGGVDGDDDAGTPGPREPSCADNLWNGEETDQDCGGPDCPPCNDRESCKVDEDCKSLVCAADQCRTATCDDRVRNLTETDRDCGGLFCPPCADGLACHVASDCRNLACEAAVCVGAACDDELRNGDETDVDCGGSCDKCELQEGCKDGTDCVSGACDEEVCVVAFCLNDSIDPGETDVDCGGDSCAPCQPGDRCQLPGDCSTGICVAQTCQEYQPYGYDPANFDPTVLDPTTAPAMAVLDCGATVFDTDTLELTNWCDEVPPQAVVQTQPAGPALAVLPLRSLHLAAGSLLRIRGSRAAVLAIHGDGRINGDIDAAATAGSPGPGGDAACGSSAGGPGGDDLIFWTQTGGGGGGGHRTRGGNGGDADNTRGGAGGASRGATGVSPLLGGCYGGRAGSCPIQLIGGAGGGAVQLSAAGSLIVNGRIDVSGGNGATCPGNQTGGSGGGSGGSITLEATNVDFLGSLIVQGGRGGDGVIGGAGGQGGTPSQLPRDGTSQLGAQLGGGGGGGGSSGYVRVVEHGE